MSSYKYSVISMLLFKKKKKSTKNPQTKTPSWYHSYRLIELRDGIYTTNINLTAFRISHFVDNMEAF